MSETVKEKTVWTNKFGGNYATREEAADAEIERQTESNLYRFFKEHGIDQYSNFSLLISACAHYRTDLIKALGGVPK